MAETSSTPMADRVNNDLYTYDSFESAQKMEKHHFLWWCAGAHQSLLKTIPSEHSKYSGLGGVILATFILASLSAGYAFYTVFGNLPATIGFALIWGLIIFNFDRFLVSTMRKYGVSKRKQIWMAVPRAGLALLIALTIARPLELKIFEKEIGVKMIDNLHKKIQLNDSLLQMENQAFLQTTEGDRQHFINRKLAIEDTLHKLQQAYIQEADGTGGSGQRGIRDLTRLKLDAYNNVWTRFGPELALLNKNIGTGDSVMAATKTAVEEKKKRYEENAKLNMGFLERNKALTDLSDEESSVFWCNLMISLLIILIETGPVLSKLIMPVGPYDVALAKEELLQMAADENAIREDKEVRYERKKVLLKSRYQFHDENIL